MAERITLLLAIRDQLYAASLETVRSLAVTLKKGIKPEELDRPTLLGIIEETLILSEKEEDKGVGLLTALKENLIQIVGTSSSAASPGATPTWKRELKVSGQIGDPKNGVSFLSLVRQIETAVTKGYSEAEIVEAIIKAIQPGSSLREYIEGKADLTLPNLKQVLRAHYKEKNATELYHELSNVSQSPREDPTEFLMRALGLRQKVLFASSEKSTGLSYSPALVQGMFKHALYTGFIDDSIRHEILPTLEEEGVTDEKLIETLNAVFLRERERKNKLGRTAACKLVEQAAPEVNDKEVAAAKPMKTPKEGVFLSELRELKAEIGEIKRTISSSSDTSTKKTGQKPGCERCRADGKEQSCQHCWRCGSGDHFRRGCRAPRQGNGKGLQ